MSQACSFCDSLFHTAFLCPYKARKTLKTYKPMRRIGKIQLATNRAVAKWKRSQKPNHDGTYNCYICGKPVPYLMTEHVKSKVRHPELRTDPNNFKPVCGPCNAAKGSKDNDN